jgi:hypothetical protein
VRCVYAGYGARVTARERGSLTMQQCSIAVYEMGGAHLVYLMYRAEWVNGWEVSQEGRGVGVGYITTVSTRWQRPVIGCGSHRAALLTSSL